MERDKSIVENLKIFLFSALYSWKKIVAIAAVFGFLLGAVQAYLKWNESSWEEKTRSRLTAQQKAQLQEQESRTEHAEEQYQIQTYYTEHSILMNIDYHAVSKAEITYQIFVDPQDQLAQENSKEEMDEGADTDLIKQLVSLYEDALRNEKLYEKIARALGEETRYVRELIRISANEDGSIYVFARHSEQVTAERIISLLDEYLVDIQENLQESICPHRISCQKGSYGPHEDLDLYEEQKINSDLLAERQDHLILMQEALKSLKASMGFTITVIARSEGNGFVAVCKWIVLGFVVGVMLSTFGFGMQALLWDKHIFREKMKRRSVARGEFNKRRSDRENSER